MSQKPLATHEPRHNSQEAAQGRSHPLAVVGIGCLFPKAGDRDQFWANIKAGRDAISEVPASHWRPEDYFDADPKRPDRTYARRGGFLPPVDFDPAEFGIAPSALEATDSAQLLGLVAAGMALRDAGYGPEREFDRDRVSVILGVTGTLELVIPLGARLGHPLWRKALAEAGIVGERAEAIISRISDGYVPWREASFPGLLGNVVAGRIANRFNLSGTNCVVDAACASSLSAAHLAALELSAGRASMVVTGGVDCFNDIFMYMCFSKTPALSPTGDARPFDRGADGTILGEGLGMLVLKRLEDAERDGDRIYAVLKGVGSSSDGRGKAIYAPSPEGQAKALRAAYAAAGISPATVELVEAHGTGTSVGDAAELGALSEVYREARPEGTWCALGSVKSMIGHTKAAAGSAALIKAVLALYHKTLPPTIKVKEPLEPLAKGETPFYLNTAARPWLPSSHPRRAAVSALGFGGSNFHAVLEEYSPQKAAPDWDGSVQIAAFCGENRGSLREQLKSWHEPMTWDQLRVNAQRSRAAFAAAAPMRLCFVIERAKTDVAKLAGMASEALSRPDASWSLPEGAWFGSGAPGKLGVLFPGQGSQYVGMGRDWACQFPSAFAVLAEADRALSFKLSELIHPRSAFAAEAKAAQESALRATENAQPALGAVALGAWSVLSEFGVRADAFAGHSYGELAALCAAGRIDRAALLRLSRRRGELMAAGDGGRGAMLAVAAPLSEIEAMLVQEKLELVLANRNAPRQGVLSGRKDEIARAAACCEARGWRAVTLPVSAAFHSPLVAGAVKEFRGALQDIPFGPGIPVYANTNSKPYPMDAEQSRKLLSEQLAAPVDFQSTVVRMHDDGVRTFLEVGAGSRLTGLVSSILEQREHRAFALDSAGKRSGGADMARTLSALAAAGYALKLDLWEGGEPAIAGIAARPKPKMTVKLSGANYRSSPAKNIPIPQATTEYKVADFPLPAAPVASDPLRALSASMAALQRMQDQAAELHARFLEGQEQAQRALQALIERQQSALLTTVPGSIVSTPAPAVPVPAPAPKPTSSVEAVLLAIVSEKTGYPAETLNVDMDLESDLGIDSIKRVEILSALSEKLPDAPKIKPEHLGTLRTLRQIAQFLEQGTDKAQAPAAPTAKGDSNVAGLLVDIVAEKTGYPPDTLNLDMDLESDLGIDSIKRVEILSALSERLPQAPKIKPEHLGTLRTLRQIAQFLDSVPVAPVADVVSSQGGRDGVEEQRSPAAVLRRSAPRLAPLPAGESAPLRKGPVWLAGDAAFAEAVAGALRRRGVEATVAGLDATPPATLAALVILAPESRLAPGALWGEPAERWVKDAFLLARRCAGALSGGALMTVSRLGGFGLDGVETDPVYGALAGLAKTAAREWTQTRCKAVDVDAGWNGAAEAVAAELLCGGPVEVALSFAGRRGIVLEPRAADDGAPQMEPGALVVVTGGARGVTAACALAFARAARPALALVGRSPEPEAEPAWLSACADESAIKKALAARFPGEPPKRLGERCRAVLAAREIRATLFALRALGVRADYHACDVRDGAAVAALAQRLQAEHGPVRGLVHGSGVLADKLIADKSPDQLDAVFDTKVAGLRQWLAALDLSQLRLLALFSSSTARYGRVGQGDYAMANEALNKAAQWLSRRLPEARVASIGWGPWDGGMVDAGLKKLFASEGVGVIGIEEGGRVLLSELASGGAVETVVVAAIFGGDAPAAQALPSVLEREISLSEFPFLSAHVLAGTPVLPLAVMAELLAHAALHGNPGLQFAGFDALRVCKGVLLRDGGKVRVSLRAGKAAREGALRRVRAELRGEGDALHAQAEILLADRLPDAPPPTAAPAASGGRPAEPLYRSTLFHGPEMRFLRAVMELSPAGVTVEAATALPPASWLKRPWRDRWLCDPAALDAAFQAMIVWTTEALGAPSLPSLVARYRQFRAFPQEGVRIAATARKNGESAAAADMEFIAADGTLVARLEGYECTLDAGLTEAFRRNAVAAA